MTGMTWGDMSRGAAAAPVLTPEEVAWLIARADMGIQANAFVEDVEGARQKLEDIARKLIHPESSV